MTSKESQSPVKEAARSGGEAFYKAQLERANKEKTQLQERLREVEARNAALLKSIFELSCSPPNVNTTKSMPLDVVQALKKLSTKAALEQASSYSGKGSAYRRSGPTDRAFVDNASSKGVGAHISPDYNPFRYRAELKGHSSAVYAIQFSPNGQLLVSTSFDRSVCFWPMDRFLENSNYEPKHAIPDAHRAPVVAVEWTFDSARAISGGLDQSAAEWDVGSGSYDPVARFLCDGLVNSVSVSPANDALFFVGTSKNVVHLFDRREPPVLNGIPWGPSTLVNNDSPVNSIHVTLDGTRFISGDHRGAIKTWDLRMAGAGRFHDIGERVASLLDVTYNDDNHRPITHVHTSPPTSGEDYGRFMAVNSYDNYLRVYDRGSFLFKGEKPELRPVHALRGIYNTHWPIKSSFFLGADYHPPRFGTRRLSRRRNRDSVNRQRKVSREGGVQSDSVENDSFSDDGDGQLSSSTGDSSSHDDEEESQESDREDVVGGSIENALILASGSADSNIYIFDVGGRPGTGILLQSLEGHKDRVYGVDFHPTEPILVSCSADTGIKIWQSFR